MLPRNHVLQNRYRIIRPLDKGGMGHVYEALDAAVDSIVAIKETFATTERLRKAFEREAKLLANLKHPVLPRVTHHFLEGRGQFLVMDYIEGDNLAELLKKRRRPFGLDEILPCAEKLLDALVYLHSRPEPIIHRDIKPANIKLTDDGEIYLLDFGLAKGVTGQMSTLENEQPTSSVHGFTKPYAPLEQITNAGTNAQTDLYSLGATLYHLLTGKVPLSASARYEKIEQGSPDPLPRAHQVNEEVPLSVSLLISRAMGIGRRERMASAIEMREALRSAWSEMEDNDDDNLPGMRSMAGGDELRQRMNASQALTAPLPAAGAGSSAEKALEEAPAPNEPPTKPGEESSEISGRSQNASKPPDSQSVLSVPEAQPAERLTGDQQAIFRPALSEHVSPESPGPTSPQKSKRGRLIGSGIVLLLLALTVFLLVSSRTQRWPFSNVEKQIGIPTIVTRPAGRSGLLTFKQDLAGQQGVAWSLAFSPDGRLMASASSDKKVRVWDTSTWKLIRAPLDQHTKAVNSVAFSPDGKMLASAGGDGRIVLWDTEHDYQPSVLAENLNDVYLIAFSPTDGNLLASAGKDSSVRLWNLKTRRNELLNGHKDIVWSVAFSPDGTTLASASKDMTIILWDVQTRKQLRILREHDKPVVALAFAADGQMLASGSVAGRGFSPVSSVQQFLKLWDVRTGAELKLLSGSSADVMAVAFSPNGTTLASASSDWPIRLWDLHTGEAKQVKYEHKDVVTTLSFSPKGEKLVSGGKDETLKLYEP